MPQFDWPQLMGVAVHRLGLSLPEFWALTPAEFRLLAGPEQSAAPMARAVLDALEARFPDQKDLEND